MRYKDGTQNKVLKNTIVIALQISNIFRNIYFYEKLDLPKGIITLNISTFLEFGVFLFRFLFWSSYKILITQSV